MKESEDKKDVIHGKSHHDSDDLCETSETEILKNLPHLGKEYMKRYRRQPHIKKHNREYMREYNKRPYTQEKRYKRIKEYQQIPEIKEKLKTYKKEYHKEYIQRPGVKEKLKMYDKKYKQKLKRKKEESANK